MKRMKGWGMWVVRVEMGNGHANYHISKLFFILPGIHLILLLILLSYSQQRKSISESMTWVMAKMNRMTKHQQASNRGVIDTFTQHKMDVVYSVSFHLKEKLLNPTRKKMYTSHQTHQINDYSGTRNSTDCSSNDDVKSFFRLIALTFSNFNCEWCYLTFFD